MCRLFVSAPKRYTQYANSLTVITVASVHKDILNVCNIFACVFLHRMLLNLVVLLEDGKFFFTVTNTTKIKHKVGN